MKSSTLFRLPSALLALSLAFAGTQAHAALSQITFTSTSGRVTSIEFEPVVFTLTTNYSSSDIQIRIFDLYAGSGAIDTGNNYTGFSVRQNATSVTNQTVNFTPWTTTLGGNSTDGDMILWLGNSFNLITGDTYRFSGTGISTGNASAQILPPTTGTYQIYLISSNDGSQLAAPVTIRVNSVVSAIPEPSTYAAIFGGLALAGVGIARRRKTAR